MIIGLSRNLLPGALLSLVLPLGLTAQDSADKKPVSPSPPKSASKPVLSEATRVSTDAAVKGAAQKKAEPNAKDEAAGESTDSAVTEFHPADQKPETSSAASAESPETSKKSPSRNLHGSVYGASGAGGEGARRTGGSVGASSKSGKTSVYVETNRVRESQPTSK